jgi:hypothetical protein
MKAALRRPAIYAAAIVVGVAGVAVDLPPRVAAVIAATALLAGAGITAALAAAASRRARRTRVPSPPDTPPGEPAVAVFRLEGEYWTVAFRGPTIRLHDSKGLRYIHRLLQTPDAEVHALDLVMLGQPPASTRPGKEEALHVDTVSEQPLVDHEALSRYRLRIEDLRDQIEEAEATNDPERGARAREELDALVEEIERVTRPGGAPRTQPGETERARLNVTRAIRSSIGKIREQDASLGHHLDHDIRTGTYCAYVPDPTTAPDWAL